MSPPISLAIVKALLKRLSPPWPSTDDTTSVGKELGSIATALGMAKDSVDILMDELFPDTTTQLIDRWEQIAGIGSVPSDPIATRRARVVAALRHVNGPTIAQLEQMLAPVLAMSVDDMVWVEPLRSFIEQGLTRGTGTVSLSVPVTAPGLDVVLGNPYWPGVIDDTGVAVYLSLTSISSPTVQLFSPSGTASTVGVTGTSGWYWIRGSTLLGKPAGGGMWRLNLRDNSSPTLTEARIMVSNNIDSGQIYNLFLQRDPSVAGSPDMVNAQRLLTRTALAHNRAFIIERLGFIVGDSHSLVGRDPVGGV